jgi:hypothetical protein
VNQLVDASCARSLDGGRTFVPTGALATIPAEAANGPAGDPSDVRETTVGPYNTYCEGLTGHGVSDPAGRIFLPWDCYGPWVSRSDDGGTTWRQIRVDPGSSIGTAVRTIHTSIAADAAGNLYYVWWDQKYLLPYLAVSRDHGQSWSRPRMIAPPGVKQVNLVSIGAGRDGRIAVSFVASPDGSTWSLWTVLSTDALGADPTFLASITNPGGPTDPVHRGACQGACAGMLDYLGEPAVAPDAHGTVWVAAVDDCTGPCVRGAGPADSAAGFVVRQLTGPWLR